VGRCLGMRGWRTEGGVESTGGEGVEGEVRGEGRLGGGSEDREGGERGGGRIKGK